MEPDAGSVSVPSQLDEDLIIEQLQRILASETFQRAPRSQALLAYAVTETLAGRGERLSERTVGRYGLLQGERFLGGQDSSVRVQASRLRKALRAYYAGEGAATISASTSRQAGTFRRSLRSRNRPPTPTTSHRLSSWCGWPRLETILRRSRWQSVSYWCLSCRGSLGFV